MFYGNCLATWWLASQSFEKAQIITRAEWKYDRSWILSGWVKGHPSEPNQSDVGFHGTPCSPFAILELVWNVT